MHFTETADIPHIYRYVQVNRECATFGREVGPQVGPLTVQELYEGFIIDGDEPEFVTSVFVISAADQEAINESHYEEWAVSQQ